MLRNLSLIALLYCSATYSYSSLSDNDIERLNPMALPLQKPLVKNESNKLSTSSVLGATHMILTPACYGVNMYTGFLVGHNIQKKRYYSAFYNLGLLTVSSTIKFSTDLLYNETKETLQHGKKPTLLELSKDCINKKNIKKTFKEQQRFALVTAAASVAGFGLGTIENNLASRPK